MPRDRHNSRPEISAFRLLANRSNFQTTITGFTPREAGVATLLMDGHTLDTASHKLGMARSTARTHPRRMFKKTRARRQSEMISVLLKTIGLVRLRDELPHPTTTSGDALPPGANAITFTFRMATFLKIPSPAVLSVDSDPNGLPLQVLLSRFTPSGVTINMDPNGGFTAIAPGAGTYTFTHIAQNSQGRQSSATVTLIFPQASQSAGQGPRCQGL